MIKEVDHEEIRSLRANATEVLVALLLAGPLAACAIIISKDQPPAIEHDLTATAVSYGEIHLAWTDNGTNEDGFQIERRQGQTGSWAIIDTIPPDTTSYIDDSSAISPETEYCYRLRAFNTNGASPSGESCTTTLAIPAISCTPDTVHHREQLTRMLTHSAFAVWREEVGLTSADPSMLVLVTDDSICGQIWAGIKSTPPGEEHADTYYTFWQIDDVYIVRGTGRGSGVEEGVMGWGSIRVVDPGFEMIDPILLY